MKKTLWTNKISRQRFINGQILKWFRKTIDKDSLITSRQKIVSRIGTTHVKEDRLAHQTSMYRVKENEDDYQMFVDWENVLFMNKETHSRVISDCPNKKPLGNGYWLVPRKSFFEDKNVLVFKRWFDVYE